MSGIADLIFENAGLGGMVERLQRENAELREALADIELQINGFYTATFTNAKSRNENRALKKLLIEQIRAILEKTK